MNQSTKKLIAVALVAPLFALMTKAAIAADQECVGQNDFFRTVIIGVSSERAENGQCRVGTEYLRFGCSSGNYSSFTFTRFALMKCN